MTDLPPVLKAALDRAAFGVSRNDAAARAASISKTYREGGTSQVILNEADALAYAFARMPATYAALRFCFAAISEALPGFAPQTLLDIGSGPGTAVWAAAENFPSLTSLSAIDRNAALRDLGLRLCERDDRLRHLSYRLGEVAVDLTAAPPADLTVASYLLAELAPSAASDTVARLWDRTAGTALIVEPGTPDGYGRILAARADLIAAGAFVIAPCPHERDCPLVPPDWCHFSQRLARSRDHLQVKRADVPFEDEKFAYVAASRRPPAGRLSRILAPPSASKVEITARLCLPDGTAATIRAPRRDRPAYAAARRWRWGDMFPASD